MNRRMPEQDLVNTKSTSLNVGVNDIVSREGQDIPFKMPVTDFAVPDRYTYQTGFLANLEYEKKARTGHHLLTILLGLKLYQGLCR